MRAALPALLLVACAGQAAPTAPPRLTPTAPDADAPAAPGAAAPTPDDTLGIDWASVSVTSDDDALALWRRLGLSGDTWVDRLALVPDSEPLREALAKSLLRQGGFVCEHLDEDLGCGQVASQIREPGVADDFESPCLRRLLALWALEELDDETLVGELAADLIAIAGLPAPEGELNRAAFRRVRDDELLLKMLAAAKRAGNHEVADEAAAQLSDLGMLEAGRDLHIDGALEASDAGVSMALHLHALVDPQLRRLTRMRVAAGLGGWASNLELEDPDRATLVRGLAGAAVAGDCVVAGIAAEHLGLIGETVPAPPIPRTAAALLWASCRAAAAEQPSLAAWKPLIDPRGLVIKRHVERAQARRAPADRDDPDAEPELPPELLDDEPAVERIPLDEEFAVPYRDELLRALPGCTSAECAVPDTGVSFRFGTRKGSKGRLLLHTLERFEKPGC